MQSLWSQRKKVGGQDEADANRAKPIKRGDSVIPLFVSARVTLV
jgi:hypothetical protein